MDNRDELMLTVPEAARMLRVGRDTAYRLVSEGRIPSIRLGKSVRIPREALLAYIKRVAEDAIAQ